MKKEPAGFEFGKGNGDTDLRTEFSNSEYGSNFRIKTEPDSEYGGSKSNFSDFKSEYGSDRGNGGSKSEYGSDRGHGGNKSEYGSDRGHGGSKSEYGLDRGNNGSKSEYGSDRANNGSKSEYGSDRGNGGNKSEYGFVKSEPLLPEYVKSEYGSSEQGKSEYGFMKSESEYGKKSEQGFVYGGKMVEPKTEANIKSDVQSEYGNVKNEYDDEHGVKPEFGSDSYHQQGGIKREHNRDMSSGDEEDERERRERKRRSRWGPQSGNAPPVTVVAPPVSQGT